MKLSDADSGELLEKYERDYKNGIWIRPGFSGLSYSDGDETETRIAKIVNSSQDVSIFSKELRAQCLDWATTYHFSPLRSNIIRPFESRLRCASVLEVGAGCGAITRYLGEIGAKALALEGSVRRAAIARARTRDLINVDIVSDDFMEFDSVRRFDFVTLIGVLEYANVFSDAIDPSLDLLKKARSLLNPGGRLIIAIENQLGLKYFAGSPEDHVGIAFYGVEGLYREDQVQTFGRLTLQRKLAEAGFEGQQLLLPFPDYKFPSSVLNESALAGDSFDAAALAWLNAGSDPQNPRYPAFAQELVWPELIRNGLARDLSNSFLWVASPAPLTPDPDEPLAWHFTVNRKPEYCKITTFGRTTPSGDAAVTVRRLVESEGPIKIGNLVFNPAPRSSYLNAPGLDRKFGRIAGAQTFDLPKVVAYFREYLGLLDQIAIREGFSLSGDARQDGIPGALLDALPRNILVPEDGAPVYFDREWTSASPLPVGYLVFRALLTLFDTVTVVGAPSDEAVRSFGDLLRHVLRALDLPNDSETCERFIELEDRLFNAVYGGSSMAALRQRLDVPLPVRQSITSLVDKLSEATREQERLQVEKHQQLRAEREQQRILVEQDEQLRAERAANEHLRHELRQHEIQSGALSVALASSREALIEYEKISRRPWRPLKRALQVSVLRFLSRLSPPLPARVAQRFLRSAKKRDLRRLVVSEPTAWNSAPKQSPEPGARRTILPTPVFVTPENQRSYPPDLRVCLHVYAASAQFVEAIKAAVSETDLDIRLLFTVPSSVQAHEMATVVAAIDGSNGIEVHRCDEATSATEAFLDLMRDRLSDFDVVGSLVTPPAEADDLAMASAVESLELLLFNRDDCLSGARTAFSLLSTKKASLVLSRYPRFRPDLETEFKVAAEMARELLRKNGHEGDVEIGAALDRPYMFWAGADLMEELIKFEAARPALAASDDGLTETVRAAALLHLSATFGSGPIELCRHDPLEFTPDYEEQQDFRGRILADSPKVLCYYLPQFHPTPENEKWHGKGFTEWTKVRAAQPIFEGHRQQRIPHSDLGYYQLSDTSTLKKQAEMMHAAGVHGMVFYHYWFSGRLILEKPAMDLLADPSVDMPYCFCWANENWTRRWDGSESEVLLQQTYSAEDAAAFIRHLIPHFRDARYIHYQGRPLLFVYRPALIPDDIPYVAIWKRECRTAGIREPLIIGTLKDGARSVLSRGMEAAIERVLHDWTGGAVAPMDGRLRSYDVAPVGVLDYGEVSEFYRTQIPRADVPVIRSILPCFDNTPRYGFRAYVTHNVSVPAFERWLGTLVENASRDKSIAGKFIVVNAWNEWAETAMVEPDQLNGYGYLNAIGRVLSGTPAPSIPAMAAGTVGVRIHLSFSGELIAQVRSGELSGSDLVPRFVRGLIKSRRSDDVSFVTNCFEFGALTTESAGQRSARDVYCRVQRLFIPNRGFFERLSEAAWTCPDEQVVAYGYGDHNEQLVREVGYWGRVPRDVAHSAPVIVGNKPIVRVSERIRLVPFTFAALLPADRGANPIPVSTVVRIHRSGSLLRLERALQCLCAQADACVSPMVIGQDLSPEQINNVESLIAGLPWRENASPIFENLTSSADMPDLRSKLLRIGIERGRSRYLAFLDYDDTLLSTAYAQLGSAMRKRGKAIGLGRVYRSYSRNGALWLTWRDRYYESGGSYTAFLSDNFAPIHSYLIDREAVDMSRVELPDDQKYMEDYLMLLQIVEEQNSDWMGLNENKYIGDYFHYDDHNGTVSVLDDAKRIDILGSPVYRKCEARIAEQQTELRSRVTQAGFAGGSSS